MHQQQQQQQQQQHPQQLAGAAAAAATARVGETGIGCSSMVGSRYFMWLLNDLMSGLSIDLVPVVNTSDRSYCSIGMLIIKGKTVSAGGP
jgi:hypothetical protein